MTYFYYFRDIHRRPLVTVCLHQNEKGLLSRGVAICSPKDSPNKKIGRAIALGRAIQAQKHLKEAGVVRREEAYDVFTKVTGDLFLYKSTSTFNLTTFEEKLLK